MIEIQENAIFIADSHYPHHGESFLTILKKIDQKEIAISQLFLMGDNFDLLFGYNEYIQSFSTVCISLLQKLSKTMEIYYIEGNHDFCLKEVFPEMKVYAREEQPIICRLGMQTVSLAHGDKYATGFLYNLYCQLLRNKITLRLLKPLEKMIISHRMDKLSQKNICQKYNHFERRIRKILAYYTEVDWVIEGHFHQSKILGKYISLPSLACQGSVGIIKEGKMQFISL